MLLSIKGLDGNGEKSKARKPRSEEAEESDFSERFVAVRWRSMADS
jgi:hypothetical protein